MALNQKKLQKKKAKQAAKNKARKALVKKKGSRIGSPSGSFSIKQAAKFPVYQCWASGELFGGGGGRMGSVWVTRKSSLGDIIMASFLLDVGCLGVKNAFITIVSEAEYESRLEITSINESLEEVEPSYARKLVEEAEKYANDLGFSPHKDYQLAKKIFGDIQSDECTEEFEFGRNGKPFYVAGPYDTEKFRNKVIHQLMKRCGSEGYNTLMPLDDLF